MVGGGGIPDHLVGDVVVVAVAQGLGEHRGARGGGRVPARAVPQHPHLEQPGVVGLPAGGRLVDLRALRRPGEHVAGMAEHVADEVEVPGVGAAAGGEPHVTVGAAVGRAVVEAAPGGEVVAEDGHVDRVAPDLVGVEVPALVPLEEDHEGRGHVAGVEAGLDEGRVAGDAAVLGVVVAEDAAAAGGPHHHHLVAVPEDVVLHQAVGRAPVDAEEVAAAARLHHAAGVDVRVADLAAEGGVEVDGRAARVVALDVLDPGVLGHREVDVAAAVAALAAGDVEALDAGHGDGRAGVAGELGGPGDREGQVEGGAEGDGAAAHRLDLHQLAPPAGWCGRTR